jgi:hypothetical protein
LDLHCNEFSKILLKPVISASAREREADTDILRRWNDQLQAIQAIEIDPSVQKNRTGAVMTFPVQSQNWCELIQIYGSRIEYRFLTGLGCEGFLGCASYIVTAEEYTWTMLEDTYNRAWSTADDVAVRWPESVWQQSPRVPWECLHYRDRNGSFVPLKEESFMDTERTWRGCCYAHFWIIHPNMFPETVREINRILGSV